MAKHRAKAVVPWLGVALLVAGLFFLGRGLYQTFIEDDVIAIELQEKADKPVAEFIDPAKATDLGDIFGRIAIPKLGKGYQRLVAEGTKWTPVLNTIGIGHYTGTALPGELGNFAVAAHRGGFGGSFRNIHKLTIGDHVYVETNQGTFDYEYRQTKIVPPNSLGVIASVPEGLLGAHEGGTYMTLTSCEPVFVNTDRIIVWLELVGHSQVSR